MKIYDKMGHKKLLGHILLTFFSVFIYSNDIYFPLSENIITGSFGEFRWNHFHTGIDISTGGSEGKPIYSPSEVWVSYIKRDFVGYGNTLFLEDSQYIYVFAHLQGFTEKIEALLSNDKFKQIIYPSKNKITFKRGEVFAFTGSSGTSIPHLHFEVRSKNNNPINPLNIFNIKDTEPPYIYGVLFECASDSTLINGKHDNVYLQATILDDSTFKIKPVNISGPFFISVKTIDRVNSPSAKLFVYKANLYSNDNLILSYNLDSLTFDLSRKSPLFFKGDVPIKNSNYLFSFKKPFESFLYNGDKGILSPDSDTMLSVVFFDKSKNVSRCYIPIVNSKEKKKPYDSFVKLKKVNNKITLIMSGSYAKYSVSDRIVNYFREYILSDKYKYYVYERFGETGNGFSVNGLTIKESIVHIDNTIKQRLSDSITLSSSNDVSFLYYKSTIKKRGMKYDSDFYKIKLCDQFLLNPIKIILEGYNRKSFYLYDNGVQTFVKKLSAIDTVEVNYLKSFIIGTDIVKPKHSRLKKRTKGNYQYHTYSLYDFESGIDWNFIADSNYLYNEPTISRKKVRIRTRKNERGFFVVKDNEGNKDTIILNP